MKKRTIICFIFLLVVVMIFVFIIKSCTNYLFDENTAQRVFNNSQYELDLVADYLATYEYSNILISEANGNMNLLLSGEVKIKDENVNHAIKKLFQRGYKSISKHTSDNAIVFLKKTRFNDFGSGFAYSIDNISQPNLQYLTELKPLSHKNWYYYEEDYNEWRLQGYTGTNAVSHRVTTENKSGDGSVS